MVTPATLSGTVPALRAHHDESVGQATLQLHGKTLVIEAPAASAQNQFIRGAIWNGKPHTRSFIWHRERIEGGRLRFDIASTPNPAFGCDLKDRPPSFV